MVIIILRAYDFRGMNFLAPGDKRLLYVFGHLELFHMWTRLHGLYQNKKVEYRGLKEYLTYMVV